VGSKDRMSDARLADANSGMLSLSGEGSVNWSRTLTMAKHAFRDGVRQAVVTTPRESMNSLQRRMPHLQSLLNQHSIPIEVTAAVELTLQSDLFDQVVHVSTVFGGLHRRYVFLRVPCVTALAIAPVVESLRRMNLTAIVLTPERCDRFRRDPTKLKRIVSLGGLVQLSAASLTDQTDRDRIKLCRHLIRQGLCHFVGSESGKHHDIPISLGDAYRSIVKWSGFEVADSICCHNASRMAVGECIDAVPKRRSILKIFSRAA
jgi:protein-tyrosine phosphatase